MLKAPRGNSERRGKDSPVEPATRWTVRMIDNHSSSRWTFSSGVMAHGVAPVAETSSALLICRRPLRRPLCPYGFCASKDSTLRSQHPLCTYDCTYAGNRHSTSASVRGAYKLPAAVTFSMSGEGSKARKRSLAINPAAMREASVVYTRPAG